MSSKAKFQIFSHFQWIYLDVILLKIKLKLKKIEINKNYIDNLKNSTNYIHTTKILKLKLKWKIEKLKK